ncbi:hypothetical protein PUNSTDRAFT_144407 [Punctularia strigosozonata HHB-11173 SS5]|uniref:uncharacterized protein n=1 Tax=Punctularia strigosozonata (strain HHB-11173) TaxID=741275 RepID=UPI000441713B|nr:uncharacterized protein PUNSTDRAFT_144407 [Punctularia strigosozonata HHB-11173 SS5]EIN07919.1 hypothetical protein PUNSTDRAFT_144407 [Punctularia strigosozonata HHB-11173 SS5]
MPRLTASLFDDVTTSDICFVFEECGTNPRSINAHSQILAKASSYFARLLSANNEETSENDAVVKQETGNDPPSLYLAEDESVASISQQSSIISSGYVAIRHASHVNVDNPGPRKRTFFIIDTPYETYRAVLFYLYTGSIEFAAPKVAHATENSGSDEMADTDDEQGALYWNFANYYEAREYDMSRGEPKSVYELADKMGIPELKEAAALCIQNSLTPENVVAELFSDFTGRHPEFQELQIKHVIDHWDEIATTSAMQEVLESPNPRTAQIMLRLFAGLGKK